MKYLCLCYYDQAQFDAMSKDELEGMRRECQPHDEALHASGHLVAVASLALPAASRTIRAGIEEASVSDGPYAATNEPVGALFIIEAQDMDEAVRIASLHPGVHIGQHLRGGIEVRPFNAFVQT
jgi:hypothetical protein